MTAASGDQSETLGLRARSAVSAPSPTVRVRNLEALDGTPIVDVKPVLSSDISEP